MKYKEEFLQVTGSSFYLRTGFSGKRGILGNELGILLIREETFCSSEQGHKGFCKLRRFRKEICGEFS